MITGSCRAPDPLGMSAMLRGSLLALIMRLDKNWSAWRPSTTAETCREYLLRRTTRQAMRWIPNLD
jgi:hypothetical protein